MFHLPCCMKTETLLFISLIIPFVFLAQEDSDNQWNETEEAYHQRMKWWKEARLGMFLHWGVYSTFGGEYQGEDHGKEMGGASAEWIYLRADVPENVYREAARNFNPIAFNAAEWIRIAKQAGVKYMVLTSKHHDGFALFDTKASDWNIMKATPFQKDIIKAYVDECHKQDMKVGFYYSHEKDWFHHAKAARDTSPLSDEYINLVKTQLKELFTNYGKIDVIWFDTPVGEHLEFNKICAAIVRKYQPECIINGRIGNNLGDYQNFGDRQVIDPGKKGYIESIMTMRLNWGYDHNDDYWKSAAEVIGYISAAACRGSNFLLNVGPTPEGRFPIEDRLRFKAIGEWLDIYGDAVYKTEGSPFAEEHHWGSFTTKPGKIFLHLFNWHGGPIQVKGVTSTITKATYMDTGAPLTFSQNKKAAEVNIKLPYNKEKGQIKVILLEYDGELELDMNQGPDFIPEKITHLTARMVKGKASNIKDISFDIIEEAGTHYTFELSEYTKFRINDQGRITRVLGFNIQEDQQYKIIYTPYAKPKVEIVTHMK